ncbi:hypothetical protein EJB05_33555, partial [Eragrostis curvula]
MEPEPSSKPYASHLSFQWFHHHRKETRQRRRSSPSLQQGRRAGEEASFKVELPSPLNEISSAVLSPAPVPLLQIASATRWANQEKEGKRRRLGRSRVLFVQFDDDYVVAIWMLRSDASRRGYTMWYLMSGMAG